MHSLSLFAAQLIALSTVTVYAGPIFDPILPPSYPLAVKNPYLNAWLPGSEAANFPDLPYATAQFWTGVNLTWSVIVRVDGQSYSLFGVPSLGPGVQAGFLQSAQYTSTHTTFVVNAGSASFILDFLSPVSPQNYIRQSAPFSYLTVSASGIGGATPDVQIYSDIDNTWAGEFSVYSPVSWEWNMQDSTSAFTIEPLGTAAYSELNDTAQWGSAVYCTKTAGGANVTAAVGDIDVVRAAFATNGSITGPWEWQPPSVVAYSQDIGTITSATNVTFAIGHWTGNKTVNYLGDDRASYFATTCSDPMCGCIHVLDDFEGADAEARSLDAQIASKAQSVGQNYSDILALSLRQAFGAIDLTVPADTLDTDGTLAFVKEISSDGNVNTLDVIYPMAPLLYIIAPDNIRLLLEPVTRYLQSGQWPNAWAVHDIGSAYPNATGHNDGNAEQMPVEECGNLLMLAYLYQQATGDDTWASGYDSLFRGYADYLVSNGLYPTIQLSTDDGLGDVTNQTGLAVKAAVALNAYGAMTGRQNYSDMGMLFADTLYTQQSGTDESKSHFTAIQGNDSTWGMQYNLYMDTLLNLSTFPSDALAMETSFYPSVRAAAGVALDNEVTWGNTNWMLFAAATAMAPGVSNEGVRDMFVDDVHALISNGMNPVPFTDKFFVATNGSFLAGGWNQYRARPVVAGHFALMALDGPDQFELSGN